jgi:hypothetical protein
MKGFIILSYYKYQPASTTAFTLQQSLFNDFPNVQSWMVQYSATAGATVTGSSSIVLFVNQLPMGGTCNVDRTTGTALSTYFVVSCSGWVSPGGSITTYELNGNQFFNLSLLF